jgi:hypothetical protein
VAGLAALHQAQDTTGDEAADSPAHRVVGETSTASEPGNGKAELKVSLETAMAKEMRIDGAVGDREAQTRNQKVLKLFPHLCGIQFFSGHGPIQKES